MFAIYESVLAKPDEAKAILQQFKAFYEKMIAPDGLGYQADAIEMFYEDAVKYSFALRPCPSHSMLHPLPSMLHALPPSRPFVSLLFHSISLGCYAQTARVDQPRRRI